MGGGAIIPTAQSVLFPRYPERAARHGRRALRARRDHRPAARPDDRRLPHRRRRAGTGSSSSTCRSASSPRCVARTRIEEPGFVADRAPVDRVRHRAARGRHGVAAVRARGGQPRGLVREPADHGRSPSSPPSRSSRSSSTSSRRDTRSSICACSRTATTRRRRRSTSSSASRSSPARCSSLYCGAVMHYRALDIGRVFLVRAAGSRSSSFRSSGGWSTRIDPRRAPRGRQRRHLHQPVAQRAPDGDADAGRHRAVRCSSAPSAPASASCR